MILMKSSTKVFWVKVVGQLLFRVIAPERQKKKERATQAPGSSLLHIQDDLKWQPKTHLYGLIPPSSPLPLSEIKLQLLCMLHCPKLTKSMRNFDQKYLESNYLFGLKAVKVINFEQNINEVFSLTKTSTKQPRIHQTADKKSNYSYYDKSKMEKYITGCQNYDRSRC